MMVADPFAGIPFWRVLALALAVPAVQAILTGINLSWLAVLVSPLHALCFLCILTIQWLWQHPAKEALMPLWQERSTALARSGRTGYSATLTALQDLGADPSFQYLLASAEPPASAPYMLSMLASVAADLCQALHAATGHVAWALLHALGASLSAGGLLWASWRGGAASSHAVRGICWAGAFAPVVPALERLFAHYLGLPMTMEEAAEAAAAAEAALALGNDLATSAEAPRPATDLLLRGMLACRLVLCGALAARCAEAAASRLWHAYTQRGVRPRPMDKRRLGLHLSGAMLLLGGALAPTIAPMGPASPLDAAVSLGLGLDRLGRSGFVAAGWLLEHPPPGLAAQTVEADAEAEADDSTLEGMKAKHRAQQKRRAAEQSGRIEVAPLLRECPRRMFGGVQGLAALDALLRADCDGDEAHEFWEADAGGRFHLVSSSSPAPLPTPTPTPKAAAAAAKAEKGRLDKARRATEEKLRASRAKAEAQAEEEARLAAPKGGEQPKAGPKAAPAAPEPPAAPEGKAPEPAAPEGKAAEEKAAAPKPKPKRRTAKAS